MAAMNPGPCPPELLPCPHCAGLRLHLRPTFYEPAPKKQYTVECRDCQKFVGPYRDTEAEALAAWLALDRPVQQVGVVFVSYRVPEYRLQNHFRWNALFYDQPGVCVFVVTDREYELPDYAECVIFPESRLPIHKGQRIFALTRTKNAGVRAAIEAGCDPIICSDLDICFEREAWRAAVAVTDENAAVPLYRMSESAHYDTRAEAFVEAPLAEGTVTMSAANWKRCHFNERQKGYGGDDGTLIRTIADADPPIHIERGGYVYHMAHRHGANQTEFEGRADHWNRDNGFNPENFKRNARFGQRGELIL